MVRSRPTKTLAMLPARNAGEREPYRGCRREQHGDSDHRVWSAEGIQQKNQRQTAAGCAKKIEEIDAVDVFDGFRDHQGNDYSGTEKGQRSGEINGAELERADVCAAREHERQGHEDEPGIDQADEPKFAVERTGPAGDHVGEHASDTQAEQGDRDGKEREMIVEDDGKNTRQRKLQQEGRKRCQGNCAV